MSKFLQILLIFLLIFSISVNIFQYIKATRSELHHVVDVLDGDTILIENSRRVRLAGVEAPEKGLCGSKESAELLKSLIGDRLVKIVPIITDSYGRDVASIYLGNKYINQEIIASGWAGYNSQEIPERETVLKLHQDAMKSGKGIYGEICTQIVNPVNPKCNIKGSIGSKGTKIYFFPGCSSYQVSKVQLYLGEQWFCSEKEAQVAGYIKSTNCYNKLFKY